MSGANDPINRVDPLFYSFDPFWTKIRKLKTHIKIPAIFPMLPFEETGGRGTIAGNVLAMCEEMISEKECAGNSST